MDFENLCRLCAKEKSKLRFIVGDSRNTLLCDQIKEILLIEFDENDGLPQKVCKSCASTMQRIQETLDEFRSNDRYLRQLQSGIEETIVKQEEFDYDEEVFGYSLKEVNIEILAPEYCRIEKSAYPSESEIKNKVESAASVITEDEILHESNHNSDIANKVTVFASLTDQKILAEHNEESVDSKSKKIRGRPRGRGKKKEVDPNRPRMNDYKCYICMSTPLGSAKSLLDHLNTHTSLLPHVCTQCVQETVEIKQIRSLNMHMKMHQQPVKCEYCDRRYTNERARNYHVQAYHLGDNAPCPSTCDTCGKVCPSALSLRTHMKRHKVAFSCDYCSKNFADKSKLKRHVSRIHEKSEGFTCDICQKRMNTIDAYELHVRTIHEDRREYPCEFCERRFTTAAFLRSHHKTFPEGSCKPKKN